LPSSHGHVQGQIVRSAPPQQPFPNNAVVMTNNQQQQPNQWAGEQFASPPQVAPAPLPMELSSNQLPALAELTSNQFSRPSSANPNITGGSGSANSASAGALKKMQAKLEDMMTKFLEEQREYNEIQKKWIEGRFGAVDRLLKKAEVSDHEVKAHCYGIEEKLTAISRKLVESMEIQGHLDPSANLPGRAGSPGPPPDRYEKQKGAVAALSLGRRLETRVNETDDRIFQLLYHAEEQEKASKATLATLGRMAQQLKSHGTWQPETPDRPGSALGGAARPRTESYDSMRSGRSGRSPARAATPGQGNSRPPSSSSAGATSPPAPLRGRDNSRPPSAPGNKQADAGRGDATRGQEPGVDYISPTSCTAISEESTGPGTRPGTGFTGNEIARRPDTGFSEFTEAGTGLETRPGSHGSDSFNDLSRRPGSATSGATVSSRAVPPAARSRQWPPKVQVGHQMPVLEPQASAPTATRHQMPPLEPRVGATTAHGRGSGKIVTPY